MCEPPPRDTATAVDVAAALGYADLPNGVRMPRLGFVTAGLGCAKSYKAVRDALEAGYRHIDTAQAAEWWVYSLFPSPAPPRAPRTTMRTEELSVQRETPVGLTTGAVAPIRLRLRGACFVRTLTRVVLPSRSRWCK